MVKLLFYASIRIFFILALFFILIDSRKLSYNSANDDAKRVYLKVPDQFTTTSILSSVNYNNLKNDSPNVEMLINVQNENNLFHDKLISVRHKRAISNDIIPCRGSLHHKNSKNLIIDKYPQRMKKHAIETDKKKKNTNSKLDTKMDIIRNIIKREIAGITLEKKKSNFKQDKLKSFIDKTAFFKSEKVPERKRSFSKSVNDVSKMEETLSEKTKSNMNQLQSSISTRTKRDEDSTLKRILNNDHDNVEIRSSEADAISKETANEIKDLTEKLIIKVKNLQSYLNGKVRSKRGKKKIKSQDISFQSSITELDHPITDKHTSKIIIEKCIPLEDTKLLSRAISVNAGTNFKHIGEKSLLNDEKRLNKNITTGDPSCSSLSKFKSTYNERNKRKLQHKWDRWTDWSSCSVTCGKGRQIRWRHCLRDCNTAETEMEEKACQLPACPPGKFLGIF